MSNLFKLEPKSPIGLDVVKELACEYPGCKGRLVWWGAKFLKFPLKPDKSEYGHACDIIMLCTECGLLHVFGHPISKNHWETYKFEGDGITEVKDGKTIFKIGNSDG